jgi:hypothetical protein
MQSVQTSLVSQNRFESTTQNNLIVSAVRMTAKNRNRNTLGFRECDKRKKKLARAAKSRDPKRATFHSVSGVYIAHSLSLCTKARWYSAPLRRHCALAVAAPFLALSNVQFAVNIVLHRHCSTLANCIKGLRWAGRIVWLPHTPLGAKPACCIANRQTRHNQQI